MLYDAMRQQPETKMVIIDPIVLAVAGDSHKNAKTRRGLGPLVKFAETDFSVSIMFSRRPENPFRLAMSSS